MGKLNLVVPTGLNGGMNYETFEQLMDRAFGRTPTQKPAATAQKPTQPVKAAAPSKSVAKHVDVPYVPPAAPTKDILWANIKVLAGGDEPKKIAAFMETPAGQRIYAQWLAATE